MLLEDKVISVDVEVDFILSNGISTKTLTIPLRTDEQAETEDSENYIESISISRKLNIQGASLAVVSSDSLRIDLISKDQSLMPDNALSPYYEYLNDNAIAVIYATGYIYENSNGEHAYRSFKEQRKPLGTFYVYDWLSASTTEELNAVTILANDILSDIMASEVPNVKPEDGLTIKEYFCRIITALNDEITYDDFKIKFNKGDISFGTLDADYNNIFNLDTSSMDNFLNNLSQSTLTNIYISNGNNLKTDQIYDDASDIPVCNISEDINIVSISSEDSNLVKYTNLELKYPLGTVGKFEQLLSGDQETDSNLEIEFPTTINRIFFASVTGGTTKPDVTIKDYNAKKMIIDINTGGEETVNCKVVGRKYSDALKTKKESIAVKRKNSTLSVVNRVLSPLLIPEYFRILKDIIKIQKNSLTAQGMFNPLINICDTVLVDADEILNIKEGKYKVVGIDLEFSESYNCTLNMLKFTDKGVAVNE